MHRRALIATLFFFFLTAQALLKHDKTVCSILGGRCPQETTTSQIEGFIFITPKVNVTPVNFLRDKSATTMTRVLERLLCVISVMKILNGNDMRSKAGGPDACDSPKQTRVSAPRSSFGSFKV